jgi:transcriptional regulator with XRE-family HTH domain
MSTLLPPSRAEDGGESQLHPQPAPSDATAPTDSFGPPSFSEFGGAPRLSTLGKRIEMLRVDRGLSKQALARSSGTSRQQLWRVMTGKADLTGSLGQRLATVLDVDSRTLSTASLGDAEVPLAGATPWPTSPTSLSSYLASPALVARSLSSLPSGDDGIALRTVLLNAIEERARLQGLRIPDWLLQLRGSVLNGEL